MLGAGWGWGREHRCVVPVARCDPRVLRDLSCHWSSGFKHLNNFNDDDRVIATHIYWELISACWTLPWNRICSNPQNNPVKQALLLSPFVDENTETR